MAGRYMHARCNRVVDKFNQPTTDIVTPILYPENSITVFVIKFHVSGKWDINKDHPMTVLRADCPLGTHMTSRLCPKTHKEATDVLANSLTRCLSKKNELIGNPRNCPYRHIGTSRAPRRKFIDVLTTYAWVSSWDI